MRLFSLLLIFLAGSISLCFATEGLVKNAPSQAPPEISSQVDSLVADQSSKAKAFDGWPDQAARHLTFESGRRVDTPICYKIRSYRVIRDDRNPDVTHPDGYSTCQPSSQFEVKRATESGRDASH
jgi:hypothetical protein